MYLESNELVRDCYRLARKRGDYRMQSRYARMLFFSKLHNDLVSANMYFNTWFNRRRSVLSGEVL
jgi:hypothetical protein